MSQPTSVLRELMLRPKAAQMNALLREHVQPRSASTLAQGNQMSQQMIDSACASARFADKMFVILMFMLCDGAFQAMLLQHESEDVKTCMVIKLEVLFTAWLRGQYVRRISGKPAEMLDADLSAEPPRPQPTPRHLQTFGMLVWRAREYYAML